MSIPSGSTFPGGEFAPGLVVLVTPEGNVGQVADDLGSPTAWRSALMVRH